MAVIADKSAPYAPATAVVDVIERYRNRGLPLPVDAEVLSRAGISQSLVARTLYALQVLDLIDEAGKPTATFESIRLAPEAEYPKRLEEWLRAAYADVFAFVDLTKDDEMQVRDAFRSYRPVGQQARMVSLFQGLCAAAGLLPEKGVIQKGPRPKASQSSAPKRGPKASQATGSPGTSAHRKDLPGLPPALAGLLESLPDPKDGWTEAERDAFIGVFGAVLNFCFPTKKHNEQEGDGGEE
jgi:hypothetical protein